MKWIIAIVLLAALAVGAWFYWPGITQQQEISSADFYPESSWLIFDTDDLSALQAELKDSGSVFHAIPAVEKVFDSLSGFLAPVVDLQFPARIIISGDLENPSFTLIAASKALKSVEWDESTLTKLGKESVVTSAESFQPLGPHDQKAIEKSVAALSNPNKIMLKVSALGPVISASLSERLLPLIFEEFESFQWIGFDYSLDNNTAFASGIAASGGDESGRQNAVDLLRYVPAEAELALIVGNENTKAAIVSCVYSLNIDDSSDVNVFLLALANDSGQVNVESITDQFKPSWLAKDYAQKSLGEVVVLGATNAVVERYANDFLSDQRLTGSAAFQPLNNRVSDASFTLFVRNEPSALYQSELKYVDDENKINSMVLQSFSELPGNKFFSLGALHHLEIADVLPVIWSNELDAGVAGGPWRFKNHYSNEFELLVTDNTSQLYLINAEGKMLWKHQLEAPVVGDVQMIDAFGSGKYQMLFATASNVHLVDRNGNNVKGFPIKHDQGITVAPSAVKYTKDGELRIFIANGNKLENYGTDGLMVNGWKSPELKGKLALPVSWYNFNKIDYLIAVTKEGSVVGYDREGNIRMKAIKAPDGTVDLQLVQGKTLNQCMIVGRDTVGNLIRCDFSGKCKSDNLLPVDSTAQLIVNDLNDCRFVSVSGDRVVGLDENLNVTLDFSLPEDITERADFSWKQKGWLKLSSSASGRLYVLDIEGKLLNKMPVPGSFHCLIADLNDNGVMELITVRNSSELIVYQLSY